ncbi:MAG: SMP-30/Gluconolaconase/LRE domain protein [Pedosphaera sp.]|nr:SMP-30/Gluconolaconase/LRE domain protein [Pedosphaera sp.]
MGGFTLQQNGDLLLFRVNNIALLSLDGKLSQLRTICDDSMIRFNDVIAAPDGSVFAGTIGRSSQSGGLYQIRPNGTCTKLFSGTGCSNGMGFSPDLRTFYWTCSTTRKIFRFDYDNRFGTIGKRRLFYQATQNEGIPDGLTIDSEGCLWSARWGGGCIVRFGKNTEVLETIRFPENNITSLCFGGENLDELFVTAAGAKEGNSPLVSALFHTRVNVCGMKEFRSRVSVN